MNQKKDFNGLRVLSLESRMHEAMEKSIEKQNGVAFVAPSMQEIPLTKNPEVFLFAQKLMAGEVDLMIFMTGVGTQILFDVLLEKYSRQEIVSAFSKVLNVARGPKPIKVLREWKIPVTLAIPEPNTWREILDVIEYDERSIDIKGKVIAIQEYGIEPKELMKFLNKKGAKVWQVPVYKWGLPDDATKLRQAIHKTLANEFDIALFTSATQVHHLLKISREEGVEESFRKAFSRVAIGSIGPVCSDTIRELGFRVDFEPSRPKLAIFVNEVSENAEQIISDKKNYPEISAVGKQLKEVLQDVEARQESIFLKAARREATYRRPVWLMRQAGRYMKDYRWIRDQVSFLELCKNKDLIAEVTITAVERLGVDAAIIFSDILLIVESFGLGLDYVKGGGPVITSTIDGLSSIEALRAIPPEESLHFVYEGIRQTRKCLRNEIPLIGFCGAPFTVASYILEGGSSRLFMNTKKFMYNEPEAWKLLMEKLTIASIEYLKEQVGAGVDAIQIFDSWVGHLSFADYIQFVQPYTKRLIEALEGQVPIINFGTGTGSFLEAFAGSGGDVIGVDFHVALDEAWQRIGYEKAIQGNLDPMLLYADQKVMEKNVKRILSEAGDRPGFIFNLGHGILPTTPVENVQALVQMVCEYSKASSLN